MKQNFIAAIPIEIILLLLAVSTNLIKDVLNPDLIKFIEKNRSVKYIILFIIAFVSSNVYTKNVYGTTLNPFQLVWTAIIIILFYLFNKLDYRLMLLLVGLFILVYSTMKIVNYYNLKILLMQKKCMVKIMDTCHL